METCSQNGGACDPVEQHETSIPLLDIVTNAKDSSGSDDAEDQYGASTSYSNRETPREGSEERCVSLNTQIMDVLHDLDHVLDSSLERPDSMDFDYEVDLNGLFEADVASSELPIEEVNSDVVVIGDFGDPEGECSSADVGRRSADPAEESKPVVDEADLPAVVVFLDERKGSTSTGSTSINDNNHRSVMCESSAVARRDSMRHLRHLPLPSIIPSAPPPTPPPDDNLPLPVLLFMETHSTNYSPARQVCTRPSSADSGPRVLGRRALTTTQRSVSLHVSPSRRRSCRGWRGSAGDRTRSSSASSRSRTPRSVSSDSCSLSSVDSSAVNSPHRSATVNIRSVPLTFQCLKTGSELERTLEKNVLLFVVTVCGRPINGSM